CSIERIANFIKPFCTLLAVVRRGANFNQFVGFKIKVDLTDDGRRESVIANHDNRDKCMRFCFERAALDRG
ncbi:MAG: hypothetical protein LH481_11465, partial [Burkholderiales bacterium]|nr:hypothetical protein [Burkholderiales bacterium]